MSADSLFYVVVLVASLAFAALGWASYLVCAVRLSRLEDRKPVPPEAPEARRIRPRSGTSAPASAIRIAPPVRAEVFEPSPSSVGRPSVPEFVDERDAPAETAVFPGSAAWMIDGVIDERFEPVSAKPPRDPAPAWF